MEKNISFGDDTCMIVLNAKCSAGKIPNQLKGIYKYIDKNIVDSKDELVKDMDSIVTEISKDRRLRHIMTLADEMIIEKRIEHDLGKQEGKLETAKKMKDDSLPVDLIAKYTGLTVEEIERL